MARKARKNKGKDRRLDQINPLHYQKRIRFSTTFDPTLDVVAKNGSTPIQVVDVIEAFAKDNAHIAHILTYLLRAGDKIMPGETELQARIRDYQKAGWWVGRLVEHLGGPPNPYAE